MNNEDSKSDYFGDYLILCLCGTLIMFSGGLSNPIMPLYAATFTNVLFLIGMVVSSFWAIRIVSEIPIGTISDYTGRKKPIVLGILFGFLGTLLCAIADNIFLIILGQAIRGAGMSAFFCVSLATITEIVPPQSRGKAMGVLQSIEFIGSTLGASLGGYVTGLLGYKGLFWTCTAIASVALALSLRLRTPDKRIEGNPLTILKQSFRKLPSMGNKTMLALCGIIFLTMIKDSGLLMTALPIYAKFYLNMSLTDVSIIMATRSAGMAIGAVSGGWLSDRIGRAKVLTIGLILAALSAFSLSLAGILILLAVLMFIDGVGMGYVQSTTPVLVTDMFPSIRVLAIGLYRTFFDLGGFVGPFIVTIIVDSYGYTIVFYVMAGLMLLNLIISSSLRRKAVS